VRSLRFRAPRNLGAASPIIFRGFGGRQALGPGMASLSAMSHGLSRVSACPDSAARGSSPLKEWFGQHYPNVKFMQADWRSLGSPNVTAPPGANPGIVARRSTTDSASSSTDSPMSSPWSPTKVPSGSTRNPGCGGHQSRWRPNGPFEEVDMLADFISSSLLIFRPHVLSSPPSSRSPSLECAAFLLGSTSQPVSPTDSLG